MVDVIKYVTNTVFSLAYSLHIDAISFISSLNMHHLMHEAFTIKYTLTLIKCNNSYTEDNTSYIQPCGKALLVFTSMALLDK